MTLKRPELPIALEIITDAASPVCIGCTSKPCICRVCRNCQQSYAREHDCPQDIVAWAEKQNVAAMLGIPPEFLQGFGGSTQDYAEAVVAAKESPVFERQTMTVPVPHRWTNIDGIVHDAGAHCCERRCPKCGGGQHAQGVYHGMAYVCEKCPEDAHCWSTEPRPPTDEVGIILTDSDRPRYEVVLELAESQSIDPQNLRELMEDDTIDAVEAKMLIEDEAGFQALTNVIEKPKLTTMQMFEQLEKAPLRTEPVMFVTATTLEYLREVNANGDVFAADALEQAFERYAPGIAKASFNTRVTMGCLVLHESSLCTICARYTCAHLGNGPGSIAFAPWRPLTTDEKIAIYALGEKLPYPLHDECLFREFGTTSEWSRQCIACMAEHDPGDEDAQR